MAGPVRSRIRIEGIVQGVGFRPFVHLLARRLRLHGLVGNDTQGVFAEVEGEPSRVERFLDALESEAPPLAVIERIRAKPIPPTGKKGFVIVPSEGGGARAGGVSPDMGTCADCLREIFDPTDRRYRYPFTNCTNCGPRFTIIRDVPYDRALTTMSAFPMCDECAREYEDPADRRFHAQPVCCAACGPRLRLLDASLREADGDPVVQAAERLRSGRVLAIKGLGGYHLAADASNEDAVAALRSRKHREQKPFAVMAPTLASLRELCRIGPEQERMLTGSRRPIVLLARRPEARVGASVAPGNRYLGAMLPYTPMHHLLASELGRPFVLTSGNVSDEPIAYEDEDAFGRLAGIADGFLVHDRPIHIRTDDSVARLMSGREMLLRRSRGYAPQPIPTSMSFSRTVLACGAELKSTFCLARGRHAFLSHHIGDLENYETLRAYREGIAHFRRLFDVNPEVVAHDLHPEYLSTKFAMEQEGVELLGVQHHHAHVASCLADNGEQGPVIGVAFDGLGFGADGTLWGGEFLLADLHRFERVGHLATMPMPGGTAAIREPWRMAAAYLEAAFGSEPPGLDVVRRNADRWSAVLDIARARVSSPRTSSAGRLFDAVSAVLGIRDAVTYEGQAAVELEQLADPAERGSYPVAIEEGAPFIVLGVDLVRAVVQDLRRGVNAAAIASRFHNGISEAIVRAAGMIREARGVATVALSGGVFQNALLTERTVARLENDAFRVLTHSLVPPNDGGISLGQAAVAGRLHPDRPR
ncbi:carbamoyltransferase HypF [soil metagenome]